LEKAELEMSMSELLVPWETINATLDLSGPVRDEAHYAQLLAFVDEAFERFGSDDQHPIFALVSLVAERIQAYELKVHPWPDNSTPASRLGFLLEAHGLSQKDLPEVAPQSVISEIISGKRKINLRQAQALASHFAVPMEVFAGSQVG
jgi:HTH-type transcriptional regulator / antitoxin HigA